ncbi:MAG: hypothetical protein EOO88_40110 [Pedobacter sp.]|nr:MAG: hypothetical protein EOO88_40110 [Pedobacter sp.]
MCASKEEVSPSCFSKESLTTVDWQKEQVARFQVPKSGHLYVLTYSYKGEEFISILTAFVSSPSSNIFDCSGVSIGKRAIPYNDFMSEAKQGKILLETTN